MWIKICGLTRNEDARAAVNCGADALGVVLYPPSPRAVEPQQLADIVAGVPQNILRYGLFVNPEREQVEVAIATGAINRLQFHGDEPETFCASFGMPYMKAIRVADDSGAKIAAKIAAYPSAEFILLDSFDPKAAGGTGKQFDWTQAQGLQSNMSQPLILAGGLNAENVATAIKLVQPNGVDVSSGVEEKPRIKDRNKLHEFIRDARGID
ncbi:MAG: phosphoribosylanthranilate isomerase [Pseudohongiellaceae bacterium]